MIGILSTGSRPVFRQLCRAARLAPLLAVALAACAHPPAASISTHAAPQNVPMTQADFESALDAWGQRYSADPTDKDNALNYAAALRRTGRTEQAVAVLRRSVLHHPDDRDVQAALGKALASDGQLDQALQVIRRAQTPDQPDWRLLSAEAAILDQMGSTDEARKLYLQAIDLAPNEPTVLSNLAMSYVLTGDLKTAEKLLRQALALPGADSRIRQNLALVVGLAGRFDEAASIASAELSPEEAAANVAYLRAMLNQQNSWQQLRQSSAAPAGTPAASDAVGGPLVQPSG